MQFIISRELLLINSIVSSRLRLIFRISGENNFPREESCYCSQLLWHIVIMASYFSLVKIWIMNRPGNVIKLSSGSPPCTCTLIPIWARPRPVFNWVYKEVRETPPALPISIVIIDVLLMNNFITPSRWHELTQDCGPSTKQNTCQEFYISDSPRHPKQGQFYCIGSALRSHCNRVTGALSVESGLPGGPPTMSTARVC